MSGAPKQVKKSSAVERIADAVLYEGYILYPYRPSAVKNQQRWNFGVVCPERYAAAQKGTDSATMQTECLVEADASSTLNVRVRFLHLLLRETGDSKSWQEAVEREVVVPELRIAEIGSHSRVKFEFSSSRTTEEVNVQESDVIVRTQHAIAGEIEILASELQPADENRQLIRISVIISNLTPFDNADVRSRDDALMHSFVSTHTILEVRDGAFVSLLDPPEAYKSAAAECANAGTYPVLVGEEGDRDCILSSPIILYDYPQIAPESAGDLFDGTEIDEILTLRIMSLTDEEKQEMRNADELARQLLERTESMTPDQLMNLHGMMKKL